MPRILILGIGGVGGWLAAELWLAGQHPTLVTGNAAITAAINNNGIALTTPDSSFHVAATAVTNLTDIPADQTFDCAYLAMMAGAVVDAARHAVARLTADGYVVAFQNGFVEDAIATVIGRERVLSATVALGSTMEAPGIYRRTTPGRLIIGELDGAHSTRLDRLRTTLAHVIETEISHNIVGVLWGKLVWNGSVSGLCAISGKSLGELFDCEIGRNLFLRAFREAVDTARAHDVDIESVIVDPDDYYFGATDSTTRREQLLISLRVFIEGSIRRVDGVEPGIRGLLDCVFRGLGNLVA
jgi:2-dehydropantoate 2-reductase